MGSGEQLQHEIHRAATHVQATRWLQSCTKLVGDERGEGLGWMGTKVLVGMLALVGQGARLGRG